jgi:D-alanine-D-alanine ligase
MHKSDFSTLGRVGVLFGGLSAERAVSLESGQAVLSALNNAGVNTIAIDLQENIIETITAANIDVAFIALHGGIGEDGRLQALLDIMNIPYTGSDTQASVLAMNKVLSKQLWQGLGLPTSAFVVLDEQTNFQTAIDELGGGAMVKPAHEGSSIGMALAHHAEDLSAAYQQATKYDAAVIAEKLLTGAEYTVAVLNGKALPVIKLETDHSFYDYDAKNIYNDTRYLCPCGLSENKEQELKDLALKAFHSLQCRGWGRGDIMANENGEWQILEVNTVPGMTSHSLVPMAAKADGYSFDGLVVEILQAAINKNSL